MKQNKTLENLCKHFPDDDNNDNSLICLIPNEMKSWDNKKCYHSEECPYLTYYKETKETIIMYVRQK